MNTLLEYLNTWGTSIAEVLSQVAGLSFQASVDVEGGPAVFERLSSRGTWLRFSLSNRLRGEQAFLVSNDDAVRLAQLLIGESGDTVLTPDLRDALEEMFRQFSGAATASLKDDTGETKVQWAGGGRPLGQSPQDTV